MNLAILSGNLGATPELQYTQGGSAFLKISLATQEPFKNKDGNWETRPEWHRVTVWGKRAEGLAKVLEKGHRIGVRGRLRTSTYEKNGEKHWSTEVVADDVELQGKPTGGGGRRERSEEPPPPAYEESSAAPAFGPDDDDIPF